MVYNPKTKQKAYLYITLAIICWGLSNTFVELGLNSIPSFPFLFYRFAISAIILTPIIMAKKHKQIIHLLKNKFIWLLGIFESLGLMFQYIGQELQIPAGLATLIVLIYAIFVPFISWVVLKHKIKLYHLIAVIISFIGIFFILSNESLELLGNWSLSILGIIMLITSALFYGLYITYTSYIQNSYNNTLDSVSIFYVVLVIVALFSTISMIFTRSFVIPTPETWIWLICLVFISTIIAFYTYFLSMRTLSANQVSLLLLLQVIVPFTIEILIYGRFYNLYVTIGIIILFSSVFLSSFISYKTGKTNRKNYIKKEGYT
ncbi:MAG: DMT family transporter [Candidatus Lokiarchaeota archaeon]|nr:DMT family transporter [Candidatus Lokiarchaeota archaeon]